MKYLTGGQALVELLHRQGVDTLFGLPGVQNDGLFNALYDARHTTSRVRMIHTRHEQGAAYMAYGYARASGRIGVYAVVPGPGMLNTTAALATAYATSTPLLCITGQIPTTLIGRATGQLHEIPDSLAVLRSLTKWCARVEKVETLPDLVTEAFCHLRTGRPRPVALEVPMDVLQASAELTLPEGLPANLSQPDPSRQDPGPDPNAVAAAAALLAAAHNPLIVIGGGVTDAALELRTVAEHLQAPVIVIASGHGVLSAKHDLSFSGPGGHALWSQADVVLAVGTRFQTPARVWGIDDALKIIRIDIDPEEMGRAAKPAVALIADAKLALAALSRALAATPARPSRQADLRLLKAKLDHDFRQVQPQYDFLQAMRAALPDDGIFVEDLTQVGYAARYMWPSYQPRTHINSGYQGTLGFGFGTALGAKVAEPQRAVVCVNGDGGFMYNVQELATAVQQGIGVVTVIFNDGAFGNVRRMQQQDHGGRLIASDLRNPDFVALAAAYGASGVRVHTPAELAVALKEAFQQPDAKIPTVIDVPVGEMASPWPLFMLPRLRPF